MHALPKHTTLPTAEGGSFGQLVVAADARRSGSVVGLDQ